MKAIFAILDVAYPVDPMVVAIAAFSIEMAHFRRSVRLKRRRSKQ
jgi:hypothetical protein